MTEEKKYTLDEARFELAKVECEMSGHNFNVMTAGNGDPVFVSCMRCGKKWEISHGA